VDKTSKRTVICYVIVALTTPHAKHHSRFYDFLQTERENNVIVGPS